MHGWLFSVGNLYLRAFNDFVHEVSCGNSHGIDAVLPVVNTAMPFESKYGDQQIILV